MKKYLLLLSVLITVFVWLTPVAKAQSEDEAVVHAVLFYSPTCPHCHTVINELLVPMVEKYGDKLQILGVDVTEEQGQALYQLAIEHYEIPPTRLGVPTLIINDVVLVGSGEIPDQFPEIVEAGLAGQGIDWPGIPGLAEAMAPPAANGSGSRNESTNQPEATNNENQDEIATATEVPPESVAIPAAETEPTAAPAEPDSSVVEINSQSIPATVSEATVSADPIAVSLASLVLGGMLFALFYAGRSISINSHQLFDLSRHAAPFIRGWIIPVLSILGLIVASYLAYVEITATEAVCGPVGDCNAVQSSPYAKIAGIPVAVLGLLNYLAILGMWLFVHFSRGQAADLALVGILIITLVGTVFSIYLTVLEIFVIVAVCLWCLSSAIITTAIMLVAAAAIRQNATKPQRPVPA